MEVKKSEKADLENKKGLFTEIGLAVVLAATLGAFEYSVKDQKIEIMEVTQEVEAVDELPPVTTQEEVKPPPPPPPPPVVEVLTIVDDDTDIQDEFELQDTEAEENTEIVEYQAVEVVEEEEEPTDEVFIIVEQMPVFPGGDEALRKFLAQEVKYPVIAQENGIQGRVFVKFVIGADGSVSNVEVARPYDPNLDKEAVRVVKSMPKWSPGKQRGKPVKVSYTVPINFVLQ
ncbi:MAG: energy transducer TonB [Bacteroidales bacterium]|jgi:protein TonB|nr:energy transducer TonB [Bacteroidales bacterium]